MLRLWKWKWEMGMYEYRHIGHILGARSDRIRGPLPTWGALEREKEAKEERESSKRVV